MTQNPKRPKPKIKLTDKEQFARFQKTARELEIDETDEKSFESSVERILSQRQPQ